MKKILLGSVALVALCGSAMAADLPARAYTKAPPMVAAIYDWSGFYIGANGGWGSLSDKWSVDPAGTALGSHNSTGAVAGGQIGYRWQAASWVFGLEAQGDWADLKSSHVDAVTIANTDRSKLKAFGLFTGQVGYAWSNVLLYAKGGAAVTSTKYEITNAAGLVASTNDNTRWGGAVGAGLEWGFAPNWSVGVEYDHLFTGRKTLTFTTPAGATFATDRVGGDVDLVTARLNYRWGGPIVAKY